MKKMILSATAVAIALMASTALGADLIAGNPKNGANVVGQVNVSRDGANLRVEYLTDSDWIITETHLHIAKNPNNLPQAKGNAVPGLFDYSSSHLIADNVTAVIHLIPLADIPAVTGDTLYIAAHAVVGTLCPCEELVLDLPSEVTVSVRWAGDIDPEVDDDSYFDALVSGGTSLDGLYDAWCIDTDRSIRPPGYAVRGVPMRAMVFSSYDCASLPAVVEPLVENCDNMDLVNWILNNIAVGDVSSGCGGAYTYGDIQRAIWELMDDDLSDSGLGDWTQCRVDEIKAAAAANGEGYVPNCGELVGVIILPYVYMFEGAVVVVPDSGGPGYPGIPRYTDLPVGAVITYVQPIVVTIPAPCCFCGETAWAGVPGTDSPTDDGDGYTIEFPGKDWSMYFSYVVPPLP